MKTLAAIAFSFASLVLLLDVSASPARSDRIAGQPALHVGQGNNQPL